MTTSVRAHPSRAGARRVALSRLHQGDHAAEAARWRAIGLAALRQVRPLELLATTDAAIEFIAHPTLPPVEQAVVMQQTVSASRFHEVFPEWRRLAALAEAARAGEARMAELRGHVHMIMTGEGPPPHQPDDG